jgi:hypothetical protein
MMSKKKVAKKQANPDEFIFTQGNELRCIATLLLKVCNKLDEIANHTTVIVEQNEDLIKEIRDNVG